MDGAIGVGVMNRSMGGTMNGAIDQVMVGTDNIAYYEIKKCIF